MCRNTGDAVANCHMLGNFGKQYQEEFPIFAAYPMREVRLRKRCAEFFLDVIRNDQSESAGTPLLQQQWGWFSPAGEAESAGGKDIGVQDRPNHGVGLDGCSWARSAASSLRACATARFTSRSSSSGGTSLKASLIRCMTAHNSSRCSSNASSCCSSSTLTIAATGIPLRSTTIRVLPWYTRFNRSGSRCRASDACTFLTSGFSGLFILSPPLCTG